MSVVPGLDSAFDERLSDGLELVDQRLREVLRHDEPFIARASRHLLDAGGKRFRPLLTLLVSELGTGCNERVIDAAAGVELTHLASLYHDDVMDEATLRRGVTAANVAYDNSTAILIGDLLFGRASQLVAGLGSEAVRIQADTFVRLCAGQIEDDRQAPEGQDPMEYYLRVLEDKTGSLISTAARYGGIFGGVPAATIELVVRYGELLGMVFQLSDDLLDITSDQEESGKKAGTDLREGVTTLPVLYVRASAAPDDARLQHLLSRPVTDAAELDEALGLLRAHKAMQQARDHTMAVATQAIDLLQDLPDGDAVRALRMLPISVADRTA